MIRNILFVLALLLLLASVTHARDITLEWDPNTEPDIAGYKIYYKASTPELPLDGTGAAEGPSPVDVGSNTRATLKGLDGSKIYYFSVTAYNSAGYESSFSNIVASDWVPVQTLPENHASTPANVQFAWTAPPPRHQRQLHPLLRHRPDLERSRHPSGKDRRTGTPAPPAFPPPVPCRGADSGPGLRPPTPVRALFRGIAPVRSSSDKLRRRRRRERGDDGPRQRRGRHDGTVHQSGRDGNGNHAERHRPSTRNDLLLEGRRQRRPEASHEHGLPVHGSVIRGR